MSLWIHKTFWFFGTFRCHIWMNGVHLKVITQVLCQKQFKLCWAPRFNSQSVGMSRYDNFVHWVLSWATVLFVWLTDHDIRWYGRLMLGRWGRHWTLRQSWWKWSFFIFKALCQRWDRNPIFACLFSELRFWLDFPKKMLL